MADVSEMAREREMCEEFISRARIIVPAIDDGTEGPDVIVCRGERNDVVEVGGHGGSGFQGCGGGRGRRF